jgi:hypothetical protein
MGWGKRGDGGDVSGGNVVGSLKGDWVLVLKHIQSATHETV